MTAQTDRTATPTTPSAAKSPPPASQAEERELSGSAANGSPLDVMLTDASTGPLRRALSPSAGLHLAVALAGRPRVVLRRGAEVAAELGRVVAGRSEVAPDKKDKRFADPAWETNALLHRIEQAYLVAARGAEQLVGEAELDWRSDQRVRFSLMMLTDALSPSNSPILNPAALRAAVDTGGRNYAVGLKQLAGDMRHSPRIPQMVDSDPFEVGGNIAVTPGAVVLRTPVLELMHYRPTTATVRELPLLVVPPMVNKYYVADLAPGRSMVEHFVGAGQQVFAISWRNPGVEQRDWGLDTYAGAVIEALDAVQEITGAGKAQLFGLCAGGIVTSCALNALAARGQLGRVAGLMLGVTMLDQEKSGTIGAMVDERTAAKAIADSAKRGYLDGKALAGVFAWLRPNDLIWSYWVNNYLLGKKPPAFDVLFWNADVTRMPAALHRDFIELAMDNALVHPDKATVLGRPVDLSTIDVDSYIVAGVSDHICPWENCYRSTALLGGKSRFVLSSSGHIAALINPPGGKSSFQVNDALPADPEQWLAGAERHPGSWWVDYAAWLGERSGSAKPAPTALGSAAHPAGQAAPGSYVLEK